ncbi:Methionyl-tRNA formyltransferase [Malassezia pachydermatis]
MHVLTPPDVKHKWGARRMRVSPVKQLALTHAIPTCELPAAGMDMFPLPSALQTSKAPMLVTASFGHRIPTTLLHQFPSPSLTLNLHPSMLPDLRGAAPIQWALARGYTETGITVQQLHPTHFDQGGILKQVPFAIPAGSTYLSLLPSIAERGAQLLVDVMATLPTCHTQLQSQHGMPGTRAPKLAPKFSVVRWDRWTAASIDGRQRGFGYAVRTQRRPNLSNRSR